MHEQPTIYALSTSPGKAGVAVIRVSGSRAKEAIHRLTKSKAAASEPRKAHFCRIRHPVSRQSLDRGLVLWFPGPHSFTGEDIVEFQVHGGPAVVRSVLDALQTLQGYRMAEQGEFAKRAFDNDKLDLTELEGLADLLNAETEVQRKLALRQAEGGLRIPYERWREQIIHSMAQTEAVIDFGEDEQIDEGVLDQVHENITQLRDAMESHLQDNRVGEIVRNGVQVAIIGPPNAGKSTLLNRLAKREAAIVSDTPGTTRDIVEVNLNLGGYPVVVSDTAGLRQSDDVIEMEGVRRAKARLQTSDIKICLLSYSQLLSRDQELRLDPILRDILDQDTYLILNKEDISKDVDAKRWVDKVQRETGVRKVWSMSCKTDHGVDVFLQDMIDLLKEKFDDYINSPVLITQVRHRHHLQECIASLNNYLSLSTDDVVLSAEELRQAANALGRITGRVDVEDVLDALFSQFCIGK
ncbi:uncharacterized protein BYT42DRAFT_498580 [Radiomyces spectabilis]|uniref:uncharacterized protein n=1 Tax=Radiomyces spectabilis TaxID=64574 RepID=UPI002220F99E|nr:uncharacterized protein BYT42DRAFT_498580 [Radiomyces spectabilis]KAI8376163.1 hypothetical protein BYT42DRAFT_498580 [Radiomyces spectabilis]